MLLKRLFIGNLPEAVTNAELSSKFSSFGQIEAVDVRTKNGATFAFLNLNFENEPKVTECIDVLDNTNWKGNLIKVQQAKESFLDKLKREQEENRRKNGDFSNSTPPQRLLPLKSKIEGSSPLPVDEKKKDNLNGRSTTKASPGTGIKRDENDSDSDSEDDVPHPFPPFRGINSYPELSGREESRALQEPAPGIGHKSDGSISNRFLAIAGAAPRKEEAPKVTFDNADSLQEKLLKIAGVGGGGAGNTKSNGASLLQGGGFEPAKANLIAKASPLNFRKKNSDEVRQKSMEYRLNEKKTQKGYIHMSLANVLPPVNEAPKDKGNRGALFGDEGSDGEEDTSFKIKPQFEGEGGERNLELSSKFASYDKRFALDERFRDEEGEQPKEVELEEEKKANFAILSDILGTTVAPKLKPKGNHPSVIVQRYDPEMDIQEETPAPGKQKESKKKLKNGPPAPEVPEKITTQEKATYQVASNLKELFTSDQQSGFSLLKSFSNGDAEAEEEETGVAEPRAKKLKKDNSFWQAKNPFKYDSSSDEEEEEGEKSENTENVFIQMYKDSFFFKKKDKRFAGLDTFFLQSDEKMEDVLYRFNNGERNELKLICKGKIKNTKRKSDKRIATLQRLKRKMKAKKGEKYAPHGSNAEPLGMKRNMKSNKN